ncbi:MAG: O-antigen ligase family protein [Chloroflexi bacterium]|nr:MAG: O-antigen ligase family protein [Chloroflexota bacterium]
MHPTPPLHPAQKFLALALPPVSVNGRVQRFLVAAVTLALALLLAWLPLKMAVLATGGVIFLTLALLQPSLVLLALIPVIPFSSQLALPLGGAKAGAMELLLLLAVALWLLKILSSDAVWGKPFKITHGPLLAPFAVLLAAVGLSWLNALSIRASLIETIKWAEMLLLVLFIVNLLPARHIKWVVLVILLTGVAQAALGLYQFVFKVGPDGFLLFDGRFLRAYGTFAQPNPYAGYLGLVLPLALSLTLWAFEASPSARSVKWAAFGSGGQNRAVQLMYLPARLALFSLPLAVMLAALFASQSRGAWLGFAGAALVTLVVRSKKMAVLVAVTGLLVVLGLLLAGSLGSGGASADAGDENAVTAIVTRRFVAAARIFEITDVATTPVTDANFATVERLAHWQAARDMWRDHPWLGVGFGNYAVIYPAYAVGRWLDPLGHAHNYLLNLGAETGLVGTLAYLIFWIWIFTVSWLVVYRGNGFEKAVAAGAMGVFTHLNIHNLVDNLYVQGMYLHVAIIMGLVSVIYLRQHITSERV